MPVPSNVGDLSPNPAANSPTGNETVGPNLDDYLRTGFAFSRQIATDFTGDTAPANPFAYMTWGQPSTGKTFRRNADNTAWVEVGQILGRPYYPSDAASGLLQTGGYKNLLINGKFNINQRAVSGTVTLAAGAYGHDRWKAGSGGCTYTFSTAAGVTTLTITAGTLVQVVEGNNLLSGDHILSWTGTATGRIASGSFAASPVTAAVTGGTNTIIEFGTGTLSLPQLEAGTNPSRFENRPIPAELALCQRYAFTLSNTVPSSTPPVCNVAFVTANNSAMGTLQYPVEMRASPTFSFVNGNANSLAVIGSGGGDIACTSLSVDLLGTKACRVAVGIASPLAQGFSTVLHIVTFPNLLFSAEL